MQTSLAPGAKWPVLLLAALAALLPYSATAHSAAQLHQHVLSTLARPARCSAQHPELCSSSPSAHSEAETSKLSAVSKAKTGEEGPSVSSAGRGDWERCRAASSSLSSQRTLGPGVHSSSACSPAASPLPPLALAEVQRTPAAAATDAPKQVTFMEALGRAAAAEAAALGGGAWNFDTWVDKRMDEANGMLHYTDLYGFLV
ncbi:UNVERIFIED_CONTAM: hypothetical protein HHA_262560 [Hammondia hammondi]|eukprot:XP_008882861.1 hypothetical protein HHA_262560 [Hammondia hammondi]